jgi:hypothetical protein
MNSNENNYIPLFEIHEEIIDKKPFTLIDLFYDLKYLQYRKNNSIYGILTKSIFNIPANIPCKMILRNNNIIDIYYIINGTFKYNFMEFLITPLMK